MPLSTTQQMTTTQAAATSTRTLPMTTLPLTTAQVPPTTIAANTRPATTAASTVRMDTTVATTVCPPPASCGCDSVDTIAWSTDNRGCRTTCSCLAPSSTIAATTLIISTASTPAPTTTYQCGTPLACGCLTGYQTPAWVTDLLGCLSCICIDLTVPPSPTTVVQTTTVPATAKCAPLSMRNNCNCAPDTVLYYHQDAWGCTVCGCRALATPATTTFQSTPAQTRTMPTTHATRTMPDTVPATTTAATTLGPVTVAGGCPVPHMCRCRPDSIVVWMSDSKGCPLCYCTTPPTDSPTVPPSTTAATMTTTVPTTSIPMTTTTQCPTQASCSCSAGSQVEWFQDQNGCSFCQCFASTTIMQTTTMQTTTMQATTMQTTTMQPTTTMAPSTTINPACGAPPFCRCKPGAVISTYKDANGCPKCLCVLQQYAAEVAAGLQTQSFDSGNAPSGSSSTSLSAGLVGKN